MYEEFKHIEKRCGGLGSIEIDLKRKQKDLRYYRSDGKRVETDTEEKKHRKVQCK